MQTDDNQCLTEKISALTGLFAGIVAIALGCIFLIFALPSLGRRGEFDYFFSQAAGGFLIILLGVLGIFASALAWPGRRAKRAELILPGLFYLIIFALLAAYQEWKACAVILAMVVLVWAALCHRKDAARNLFLFAGLFGFLLAQVTITMLPYGWKAWSMSGVLFLFGAILLSLSGHLCRVSQLSHGKGHRIDLLICTFLSLALIIFTTAALVHLPGPAGPGTVDTSLKSQLNENDSSGQMELKECDCKARSRFYQKTSIARNESLPEEYMNRKDDKPRDGFKAKILSPEDVRTFYKGEMVLFSARSCPGEPCSFLWHSSQDGIIGKGQSFQKDNLSLGWHNITVTVANSSGSSEQAYIEIAIAKPWICGKVDPRPKYYPPDTPCQDIWPNATKQCQEMEVCHPDLDWIVAEAVDCCDGTPKPGKACADACNRSGGDRKKCRGIYLINAFGPDARYMKGYALFKACCSGYPECTRLCGYNLTGTCHFLEGYNANVSKLSCRPEEKGVNAWHSDTNMSMNSATMELLPTHATVNILQTGVCSDYSAALTTMLRKAGYNKSEALSTSSSAFDLPIIGDHPGHFFNLVLLPGDTKYHIVDTTGNGDGINLGRVPGYFGFTGCFLGMPSHIRIMDWWMGYCSKILPYSNNDAGYFQSPEQEGICGCSEEAKPLWE
ncbi:MAG: hypothetical protein LUO89_01605 [Methanothrix sp.]|nr:hypothetical protein [Methanothrix sp.]